MSKQLFESSCKVAGLCIALGWMFILKRVQVARLEKFCLEFLEYVITLYHRLNVQHMGFSKMPFLLKVQNSVTAG